MDTTPHPRTGPRDVFMHLLAIIFLYMCVFAFGALLFQFIDIAFPDPLQYYYNARSSLRWPLSVLVIMFPLYVWLMRVLQREIKKDPAKRELRTRKWLMAFTLFVTSIAIVTDLITLIYKFLGGGLSVPFLLKVLAVFLIAASVFLYYGWNFKKEMLASDHPQMKLFVRGIIALAGIAIVIGFFLAGSPFAERQRQFDERRVSDLSSIQWQIVSYWQAKQALPTELSQLNDELRGYIVPMDPETAEPYEYRVLGPRAFELCATFATSSQEQDIVRPVVPAGDISETWTHEAERTCFSRTIDPDRYPATRN